MFAFYPSHYNNSYQRRPCGAASHCLSAIHCEPIEPRREAYYRPENIQAIIAELQRREEQEQRAEIAEELRRREWFRQQQRRRHAATESQRAAYRHWVLQQEQERLNAALRRTEQNARQSQHQNERLSQNETESHPIFNIFPRHPTRPSQHSVRPQASSTKSATTTSPAITRRQAALRILRFIRHTYDRSQLRKLLQLRAAHTQLLELSRNRSHRLTFVAEHGKRVLPVTEDNRSFLDFEDGILKVLDQLDRIQSDGSDVVRQRRKSVVRVAQNLLDGLDEERERQWRANAQPENAEKRAESSDPKLPVQDVTLTPAHSIVETQEQQAPLVNFADVSTVNEPVSELINAATDVAQTEYEFTEEDQSTEIRPYTIAVNVVSGETTTVPADTEKIISEPLASNDSISGTAATTVTTPKSDDIIVTPELQEATVHALHDISPTLQKIEVQPAAAGPQDSTLEPTSATSGWPEEDVLIRFVEGEADEEETDSESTGSSASEEDRGEEREDDEFVVVDSDSEYSQT